MNAAEVEFLAEKTPITIIPNFSHDKIYLISGDIGPFQAGLPVEVPLWLGVDLKQRGKCRLIPPDWMDAEKLTEKKDEETQTKVFTEMPSEHYIVVSQLVLSSAPDDVPNIQQVKTLIKDIWDLRISKLRSSVNNFIQRQGSHAQLDHLTLMELNSIRPLLPHALDQIYRLSKTELNTTLSQSQASQDL